MSRPLGFRLAVVALACAALATLEPVVPAAPEAHAKPPAHATSQAHAAAEHASTGGSVIFIHPDGTSAAHWEACRILHAGPDSSLNWDRMPHIALYRSHVKDGLTATSHGGATIHAYGVKVMADSYGLDGSQPVSGPDGPVPSILSEVLSMGLAAGIVNSGTITEPGTGCFAASVVKRTDHAGVVAGILQSAPTVILGGGEAWFLPESTVGRHGPGRRQDGRNLIEEAKAKGYTVVRTREELQAASGAAERLLGLFATDDTYNDLSEEELREKGLPAYDPAAPTVAEMTRAALAVLGRGGRSFLLVVEEEGTDNFGNSNNARDCLEALRRADEAIGVARDYLRDHPRTLLLTAADSNAGGLAVVGLSSRTNPDEPLPPADKNGAPWDGRDGTGTPPFLAAPDAHGQRLPFAVAWASYGDLSGNVIARGEGWKAETLPITLDNTGIHRVMREVLIGGEGRP